MKRIYYKFEKSELTYLNESELKNLFGGFWPAVGAMASLVGLYEWGYQYAHRKLEQAK
jgi:hypothetical protein